MGWQTTSNSPSTLSIVLLRTHVQIDAPLLCAAFSSTMAQTISPKNILLTGLAILSAPTVPSGLSAGAAVSIAIGVVAGLIFFFLLAWRGIPRGQYPDEFIWRKAIRRRT